MNKHSGAKLWIHGTIHPKDNQLQSNLVPLEYRNWEYRFGTYIFRVQVKTTDEMCFEVWAIPG